MPIKVNKLVLWRCHRGDPKLIGKLVIYTLGTQYLPTHPPTRPSISPLISW